MSADVRMPAGTTTFTVSGHDYVLRGCGASGEFVLIADYLALAAVAMRLARIQLGILGSGPDFGSIVDLRAALSDPLLQSLLAANEPAPAGEVE